MDKPNKLILKNTILLYVRSIVMLCIGLYTSRITLAALGVEDFGIYNVVGGVVTMFLLMSSTMTAASQRFITYALGKNDLQQLKAVFNTCVTLHLVIALITIVILELVGLWLLYNQLDIPTNRLSAANIVMQFSILTTAIGIICVPYDALIVAHERMNAFAYIGIYDAFMKLVVAFLLLYANVDKLILFAFLIMCIALSKRIIYNIYTHRNFEESRNVCLKIDRPLFKEISSFAGWNLLGNGSLILRNHGVDILMNIYFGVTVNAAKGICNVVQGNISTFVANFQTAVNPQLTKSVAEENYARTIYLINQGGRLSFFLLSLFCVPLIVSLEEVLSLWLVEVPPLTIEFIEATFIYMLWDSLSRFLINTIMATGNIRNYQLMAGSIKMMAFPIAYVTFYLGGNPIFSVYINIVLELVCLIVRLYYNRKRVGLSVRHYLFAVIMRCWGVFILSMLFSLLLKQYMTANVFFLVPVTFIVTITFISLLGINGKERYLIKSKILSMVSKSIISK